MPGCGDGGQATELDPKQSDRGPGGELGNRAIVSYRGGSGARLVLLLRDTSSEMVKGGAEDLERIPLLPKGLSVLRNLPQASSSL